MTGRTVTIDLSGQMATDAEAHVVHVVHLEDLGHARDVAVTGLAGVGPHRLDVAHMREVGETSERVDPNPLELGLARVCAVAPELTQLLDLGAVGAVGPADPRVAPPDGPPG